jgi:protein-S-isoprenylcysteine O-methyltransferase Ste14
MPLPTQRQRAIAVSYGVACHSTFAVAIAMMMRGLYDGLASGAGRWTGSAAVVPHWTPDHLAVAIACSVYCVIGPLLKEERYRRRSGAVFDAYQRSVPYWIPRLRAEPEVTTMTDGAA